MLRYALCVYPFCIEVFVDEIYDLILIGIEGFDIVVEFEEVGSYLIFKVVNLGHFFDGFTDLCKLILCLEQFYQIAFSFLFVSFRIHEQEISYCNPSLNL